STPTLWALPTRARPKNKIYLIFTYLILCLKIKTDLTQLNPSKNLNLPKLQPYHDGILFFINFEVHSKHNIFAYVHLVPFLRILIPFIFGILAYHHKINGYLILAIAIFGALLYLTASILKKQAKITLNNEVLAGIGILLCLLSLGYLHTFLYNTKPKNHVSHFNEKVITLKGVWKSDIRRSSYTNQFYLNATHVQYQKQWIPVTGKVLLKTKLIDYPKIKYGDTVVLYQVRLQSTPSAQLPYQFDYAKYLFYMRVYSIIYLYEQNEADTNKIKIISNPSWSIFKTIQGIKEQLLKIYENLPTEREQAVAKALVLGYQDDIDFDTQQDYIITGSLHILAVSGMHVGLIYLAVFSLLQYIPYINRKLWLKAVLTSVLVIFYAFLSGASPSIMRAAIMFSFVLGGKVLQRYQNIYNTLCVVLFCMLLYNPNDIFNLGMLLSFAAVIGIVALAPAIQNAISIPDYTQYNYGLKRLAFWVIKQIWVLTSVCIAAQLFTLPISLYFFYQFPTYFLLSNLIIVPISTLALFLGIILLFVHWIPFVGAWVTQILFYLLYSMNEIIDFLAKLPYSTISPLPVTFWGAVFLMITVSAMSVYFLHRKKIFWWIGCISVLAFCCTEAYRHYKHYQAHWVTFKIGKNTALMYVSPYRKAVAFVPQKALKNTVGLYYVSGAYLAYHGLNKAEVYPYSPSIQTELWHKRYDISPNAFLEATYEYSKGKVRFTQYHKQKVITLYKDKVVSGLENIASGKITF
ncbi:MAG: ComEC/Rec2 family competence protein, partial [Bacteroidia bacterium]|nr:ComEC/Rec2 family competence protein [Bacteroidia bacterium]